MSRARLNERDHERLERAHLEVLKAQAVRKTVAQWLHSKYALADDEAFDLAEGRVIKIKRPPPPPVTEPKVPESEEEGSKKGKRARKKVATD